jgi:capsular exopolysaccharide synthesis family protein
MVTGLGVQVIGSVPMLSQRRWRLLANGEPTDLQGIMDESVDGIRAMLLHSPKGESARTLLVTSAKAGEGKTTVASSLAASMGRSGRRTLLIDGDLRRPAVHRVLDMPLETGLSEVVRGECSIEDVIRPSRATGLWFMSAGQCDQVSLQALTKPGLAEIFEKLRAEFDFVVVDSGPVLSVVDPVLLGQHCDAAIISVVRRVSQIPAVYEACDRLKSTGIHVTGCVINGLQGNPLTPGYYAYAYGYTYGYGNGQQHADAPNVETTA